MFIGRSSLQMPRLVPVWPYTYIAASQWRPTIATTEAPECLEILSIYSYIARCAIFDRDRELLLFCQDSHEGNSG